MGILSMVGNSFGCSASGERLVSAARDGDLQEARALLECNPRLARYSTFGVRNSPLHYSAAKGHHEIVFLLLESGVDINLRNASGQTALMKACQYGHWEVVQILILFKANIHKTDYLNGGTAIHFAATNGHTRCIRLLLGDYIPSTPDIWHVLGEKPKQKVSKAHFDESALSRLINKTADGGITTLHMAALNGHAETVHLLLDLGASVSKVTVEDGTIIDLIGAGSTALHYAACGGNAQCCQILLSRGASLSAKNSNGLTPLMVAVSWHRNWLEGILAKKPEGAVHVLPSPYLSLPLMSILKIARECGWRDVDQSPALIDPCAVCLERKCTVAAEGCHHEFCTRCALYLSSSGNVSAMSSGPLGSIPCPLCRNAVVSFFKLPSTKPLRGLPKTNIPLALCTTAAMTDSESAVPSTPKTPLCKPDINCSRLPPFRSLSFRSFTCQRFPSIKFKPTLCIRDSDTSPSLVKCSRTRLQRSASNIGENRRSWASRTTLQRSTSNIGESRRSWAFTLNQCVTAFGN